MFCFVKLLCFVFVFDQFQAEFQCLFIDVFNKFFAFSPMLPLGVA